MENGYVSDINNLDECCTATGLASYTNTRSIRTCSMMERSRTEPEPIGAQLEVMPARTKGATLSRGYLSTLAEAMRRPRIWRRDYATER